MTSTTARSWPTCSKRRRKLAAVRLQVTPTALQEIVRILCGKLELTHKRVFAQKSPLDLSFFYKLTAKMEADGHRSCSTPRPGPCCRRRSTTLPPRCRSTMCCSAIRTSPSGLSSRY